MKIGPFIVVFTVLWWLIFFIAISIGVKIEENPEVGHATSAPKNPRILLRIVITTVISFILSFIVLYFVEKFLSQNATYIYGY